MTAPVDWDTSLTGSLAGDMSWLHQDQDLPWLEHLPALSTGLSSDSGYEDDESSLSLDFLLESTKLVDGDFDLESMTTWICSISVIVTNTRTSAII